MGRGNRRLFEEQKLNKFLNDYPAIVYELKKKRSMNGLFIHVSDLNIKAVHAIHKFRTIIPLFVGTTLTSFEDQFIQFIYMNENIPR